MLRGGVSSDAPGSPIVHDGVCDIRGGSALVHVLVDRDESHGQGLESPSDTLPRDLSQGLDAAAGSAGGVPTPTLSPRPPAALSLLHEVGGEPPPPRWRWRWSIVTPEFTGRVMLPVEARRVLGVVAGGGVTVRARCRGVALQLRSGGAGVALGIDGRGRMVVPVWLRRAAGSPGSVLVATRLGGAPVVLVAPIGVLDGLGDVLVGEGR